MKTKSMIAVQTSDIIICRSSGGMPHPAWLLTTMAYASGVSYQAEQGIPPSDRKIIMSEDWASIVLYRFLLDIYNSQSTNETQVIESQITVWFTIFVTRHFMFEVLVSYLVNWCFEPSQPLGIISGMKETFSKRYIVERTKRRVVGRIYGMKYSLNGHEDINRHKNRIKRSWQAQLVYVRHKLQHSHHVKVSPPGSGQDGKY